MALSGDGDDLLGVAVGEDVRAAFADIAYHPSQLKIRSTRRLFA
jgi:hypothetical protein